MGRSGAGPMDSSSTIAGPQRAAQGAGICRNRAAFELVAQGSGVLCELAQFELVELVADLEVNWFTSSVSQVKTLAVITVEPIVGGDMRYGGEACKVPTRHDHHGETPTRDQSQLPGES